MLSNLSWNIGNTTRVFIFAVGNEIVNVTRDAGYVAVVDLNQTKQISNNVTVKCNIKWINFSLT